jgi:hypothetical protein
MKHHKMQLASIPEDWLNQTSLFYADTPCAPKNQGIIISLNRKSYARIEIQHTSSNVFYKYIQHNIVACF